MSRYIEGTSDEVQEALFRAAAKVGVDRTVVVSQAGGFVVPGIVADRYIAPNVPTQRRASKKTEAPAPVVIEAPAEAAAEVIAPAESDTPAPENQE